MDEEMKSRVRLTPLEAVNGLLRLVQLSSWHPNRNTRCNNGPNFPAGFHPIQLNQRRP
ncbi:hypothetical protein COLO4_16961 [Corchorus olitorius]|uniref:Uncharacterized protein n=1 Tax=Corchorus olitorius TaxID=93759 RepID=A0A1R3JES3_9ROSI|nr:hypothetical protein COLO4_16961 [Corchorus olitorius]